ncbi:sugar phosphate isomerase/epimerase family protein [Lachnoclostridium sp. Marseille-P6806]|uniref:sugar phosphate isomerase/epimerase family protein n=1 Tax=Lachnoclostridium sp. Marseille-P6806 TaxID=2364793 RepID=UPI0010308DA8|nr:TIM barrel protein [Lachnoclostridium sp. Marseille-P6806]
MMKKAVQQIMLGTVCTSETQTLDTLKSIKKAGYDALELNGFMIKPTSLMVRTLTKLAGMPTGKGGSYNWCGLLKDAGLSVTSIHEDLGSIERDVKAVVSEARQYGTEKVVITGMYRFDYRNAAEVDRLCSRLSKAGMELKEEGIELLYHNHNIEWLDCGGTTAYERIISGTNPSYLNFEFDSYWPTEAGVDALSEMKKLGDRMKLYHINDRGTKVIKTPVTPILKSDSMELGTGNMPLLAMIEQAKRVNADAIILETHKNWIDKSPVRSLTVSGEYLSKYL